MSTGDFEIHLDRDRFNALWKQRDDEAELFPFGEDDAMLDRIIEEELGPSRRRIKRR